MELTSEQHQILRQVSDWKRSPPNAVSRVSYRVFAPISKVAGRLAPQATWARLLSTIEGILGGFAADDERLDSPGALTVMARSRAMETDTRVALLHRGVHKLEPSASHCINTATVLAGAGGFGTGAIGWCGVFADIPAQLAIQMQMIRRIGKVHGFNTGAAAESAYVLRVLDAGTAPRLEDKARALEEAAKLRDSLGSVAQTRVGEAVFANVGVSTAHQVANTICARLTAPALAKTVPLAGAGVGASFGYLTTREVGLAAFHLYRERLIMEQRPKLTGPRCDAA